MEELLTEAKLTQELSNMQKLNIRVVDLYNIISDNKVKVVPSFQKMWPDLKLFDCHRLKAILLDLKKSGKIIEILIQEGSIDEAQIKKRDMAKLEDLKDGNTNSGLKGSKNEPDNITPNKKDKVEMYYASMESLKAKRRKPSNTFKRREALNKKGWEKDENQMTIDKFLVPKRKKKVENNRFMMMDCSDSYSWMPTTYDLAPKETGPNYRSKKRINKLMGQPPKGPMTRSRLASKDFTCDEEWSSFTTLQDLKRKKKTRLNQLKHQDMFTMSAWDEDSALSVQSHITRKFRKRKAIPFSRD